MDVFQALKERRTVIKFKAEKVPDEKIRQLMQIGLEAPSASNTQPIEFLWVKNDAVRKEVAQCKYDHNYAESIEKGIPQEEAAQSCENQRAAFSTCAPIAILTPSDTMRNVESAWCCITAMWVAAPGMGLGLSPAYFTTERQEAIRKALGVPDNYRVHAVLRIGVPEVIPDAKPRKPLDENLHTDAYGKK